MHRRTFFTSSLAVTAAASALAPEEPESPGADLPERKVLAGSPVVSGPAPDSLTVLQPVHGRATGFLEYDPGDGRFQRVDTETAGHLPCQPFVLKFRLPPLPPGRDVRYRVTVRGIEWVPVKQFVHGAIKSGPPQTTETHTFRTLDPAAAATSFVVWNDTHEREPTLRALHSATEALKPDFLLWNGDQTNDVHFEKDMAGQFLAPAGLAIAAGRPLAYGRGNHDVRGPAARQVAAFTGTPEDRFFYAFRSGPVAALVMDTGEDKPDDHPYFAGLAAFGAFRARQRAWLERTVAEPWFREAPFRLLFCHIPLWWIRDRQDIEWWEFSKVCRDAWLPVLETAGVRLVISGHTHEAAWMPASATQPLGQLVGGGPHPAQATLIHGTADRHRLTLHMKNLEGGTVAKVELDA